MPISTIGNALLHYKFICFNNNSYNSSYYSLSTMQGVMAIPSLFLFHNGKAAARYNETEYKVDLFANFITRYTGKILLLTFSHK